MGGETRSRGPARCLILEACKFPRRLGSCPRTHYRQPRRLSHAPGPTYVDAVLHSVVCPSPLLRRPPRRPMYLPSLFHAFSERRERDREEKKTCRVQVWRTGHEPYLAVFLLLQCIVHDYVWGGTPRYICTHGQREETEVVGAGGVPRQLRKVQCGVSKEERVECKHDSGSENSVQCSVCMKKPVA